MRQVWIIGGGDAYVSHDAFLADLRSKKLSLERLRYGVDWKASLQKELGTGYDVLFPGMPNKQNAQFEEWKILFQKCSELMRDGAILVGHSLGGVFLAQYLSEEEMPIHIAATILVAAPFEIPGTGFVVRPTEAFARQGGAIHLFHSKDDPVVEFSECAKFKTALPNAVIHEFTDRKHFTQVQFPELVELIKSI